MFRLLSAHGEFMAEVSGKFRHEVTARADFPAVGDWVLASTRSDEGRRCRDTFTSLKKTCRKLGVGFWSYLRDRLCGGGIIPRLSELIGQHAAEKSAGKVAAVFAG